MPTDDDDYPDSWGFKRQPTEEPTIGERPISGLTSGTGLTSDTDGTQPEPPYPTEWRHR